MVHTIKQKKRWEKTTFAITKITSVHSACSATKKIAVDISGICSVSPIYRKALLLLVYNITYYPDTANAKAYFETCFITSFELFINQNRPYFNGVFFW